MVHPGSGFVTVFVAQDSGAVAKIHILQVGKVDFVQQPGFSRYSLR